MKRMMIIGFFALIVAMGCAKKAPEKKTETRITSGRMVTTSTIEENKMKSVTVFSGNKARSETSLTTSEGEKKVVQVWIGRRVFSWVVGNKSGQTMSAPKNWVEMMTAFGRDSKIQKSAKNMGTDEIAGLKCDVFLIENPREKEKLWFYENPQFPILLKSISYLPRESQTTTEEISFNIDVPESSFDVPKDIDFEEVDWEITEKPKKNETSSTK